MKEIVIIMIIMKYFSKEPFSQGKKMDSKHFRMNE